MEWLREGFPAAIFAVLRRKSMQCYETEHYHFHFNPGTKAEEDILQIAAEQEACFRYICKVLNTVPPFKIRYFLCDSPEEVGRVYGDDEPCNGFAAIPDAIYAVYNEKVRCIGFHEDAHVISYTINRPDSPAIREGLAMYFDRKWWGISNWEWTGYYLKKNGRLPIAAWLDREAFFAQDCTLTYPVMGAFTDYLIAAYGIEAYLAFYNRRVVTEAMEEVFGKTPEELEQAFTEYVKLLRLDAVVETRMEELLKG